MKLDELAALEHACSFAIKKHKQLNSSVDDVVAFYTGFGTYWHDIKAAIVSPNTQRNYATALRKVLLLPPVKGLFPDEQWHGIFDGVDKEVKDLQHRACDATVPPPDPLKVLYDFLQNEVKRRDADIEILTRKLELKEHEIKILKEVYSGSRNQM